MSRQDRKLRLERERALFLYRRALETGDIETMDRIRRQAEADPVLERQIEELEDFEAAQVPELALAEDAELVRRLLQRHLRGPAEAADPAPITVGEVAGKLLLERSVPAADQPALQELQGQTTPVPARLGLGEVRRLGQRLGVRASEEFWRLFREAALLLGVGQSRQAGFAAARRQTQPPRDEEQRRDGPPGDGRRQEEDPE